MTETQADLATPKAGAVGTTGSGEVALGLKGAQLRILGRALANVAHDIQNHLATISESAGWMGDLLELENKRRSGWIGRFFKRSKPPDSDIMPFSTDLHTIQEQVVDGSKLNQRLSDFAHHLEETYSVLSGNKALGEIQDALLRTAEEKGIDLKMELTSGTPMIKTDPPGFQLAVFFNAEQVMEGLGDGDWVVLEAKVREGRYHICLSSSQLESHGLLSGEVEGEHLARQMVEGLGGRTWKEHGEGEQVTTLSFPLAKAEK
jgi:hypothetical protein